jgi:hypothetical protein
MMQRILSQVLLSIGVLALMCGALVHGASRDSRNAEDRKQMMRGAEIAVGGLVLVSASALVRKSARDNSSYQD